MTKDEWYRQLFERLDNSRFRSSFHLKQKDIDYINEKGLDTIRQHAKDFIAKREAPAYIANDGKQTPMKGHPVFIAQHATATCCRECIRKWHKMQPGKELSQVQQDYLVDVINIFLLQMETIRQHAKDFITKREAPAYIANDGKQTPMRGHPVFIAQHATATCCRECIRKWHKMQPGKELSRVQQDYLVDVIMTWIQREMDRQ